MLYQAVQSLRLNSKKKSLQPKLEMNNNASNDTYVFSLLVLKSRFDRITRHRLSSHMLESAASTLEKITPSTKIQ